MDATPAASGVSNTRPRLFSNEEAAAHIGVNPRTLEVWRCTKRHQIPFIKVGRLVRYRREDLDRWLASRTVGAVEEQA